LADVIAAPVEMHEAAVAITVADIDIAILRIDGDGGGLEKAILAGIERVALDRAVRGIEDAALADLHQQIAVLIIFVDLPVELAGNPDIALEIDVQPLRLDRQ